MSEYDESVVKDGRHGVVHKPGRKTARVGREGASRSLGVVSAWIPCLTLGVAMAANAAGPTPTTTAPAKMATATAADNALHNSADQASEHVAAHKPAIKAAVDVKPDRVLTAEEMKALGLAAREVVQHAIAARQALQDSAQGGADNDKKKTEAIAAAKEEISQALKLLGIINDSQPTYKVTTRIDSADRHYQHQREVKPHYVMMMDEETVDENIVAFSKQTSARQDGKAHSAEEKSDVNGSPGLDWLVMRHQTVKLDSALSLRLLKRANKALDNGSVKQAVLALEDVEALGVVDVVVESDLPLMDSLNRLNLASQQIGSGLYDKAVASLKQASASLKRFEQQGRGKMEGKVKELRAHIDKLLSETENKAKGVDAHATLDAAQQKLGKWWGKLRHWVDTGSDTSSSGGS